MRCLVPLKHQLEEVSGQQEHTPKKPTSIEHVIVIKGHILPMYKGT